MRKRLLFEGWRFIPHSYALVAQSHCLCVLQRQDIDLRFVDLPYFSETWQPTPGLFLPSDEQALADVRAPEPTFTPDATFTMRPERPDFSAPRSGRKFVFGTAEFGILLEENLGNVRSGAQIPETISVITPSRWSALAFERFGVPLNRIHVVPHGIDPMVQRPDEASRNAMRKRLRVQDNFLFMSVGAMTWNKGLDLLLAAFSRVAETDPNVRLLLKGADALYPSKAYVAEVLGDLPARARETVASRLIYIGGTFSGARMADLLRAADCYVSPYRAEGFNMPVLEAAACGTLVICTAGGPTDEFTEPSCTRKIRSSIGPIRFSTTQTGDVLMPELDHLVELMRDATRDPDAARKLGARAATYAVKNFTWSCVTDLLVERFFPDP